MYSILLAFHSITRWLVLISVITSVIIAAISRHRSFTPAANAWRHWTATIAHLQLLLGMLLYLQSPVVKHPLPHDPYHLVTEHVFFRYIHITFMFIAVIVITIGSAKAKRAAADEAKYRIMLTWFATALLILFIAIPWPFSPLAGRPFIRKF